MEDIHLGLKAEHADPTGVTGRTEHIGAVGAVDGDRVGRVVTAAVRPAQIEIDAIPGEGTTVRVDLSC